VLKNIKIYLEKKKEIGSKEKSKGLYIRDGINILVDYSPQNNHFQSTDSSEALIAPRCF